MYEWFTIWTDQHLAVTITLASASGLDERAVLAAFDADIDSIEVVSFGDADAAPDAPRVRIGRHDDWYYAIEHFTTVGASDETIGHLAAGVGGAAFSLACNLALNTFQSAQNGRVTTRFDLGLPRFRYGAEPDRYIDEIAEVGLLAGRNLSGSGAELLARVTGVEICVEMLERPLTSAVLSRSM